MTLTKFKKRNFPWISETFPTWLNTEDFFSDDFFTTERNVPAMNIKETDTTFEIELAIPGFSKKEIEVTLEDDYLKVFATKSTEEIEKDKEAYTRKEFTYNSFERMLKLPLNINKTEEIKANYHHGILTLNLIKNETKKETPKKVIEIA